MTLKSMTGFARTTGSHPPYRWAWEVKAVNAKGLDLRLRLPPGFDMIEADARARLAKRLGRGTCYATLTLHRESSTTQVRINQVLLRALVASLAEVPVEGNIQPASLDGLLAVRGVVEVTDTTDDEAVLAAVGAAALASLDQALDDLVSTRITEGASLGEVLDARLDAMQRLTDAAEATPGRKVEAVRARLQQSIDTLTNASPALDPARLHQEALMIAAKADIREELDRLQTHIASGRELVLAQQPVGRRLDFLAQELGREANTLCAKSNDPVLTAIGMELRVEIEQFREQVQNIE